VFFICEKEMSHLGKRADVFLKRRKVRAPEKKEKHQPLKSVIGQKKKLGKVRTNIGKIRMPLTRKKRGGLFQGNKRNLSEKGPLETSVS